MARLVRQSDPSFRRPKNTASPHNLQNFVQAHEFPLRLPRLSTVFSPVDVSPDPETVMLLSQTASRKLLEARSRDLTSPSHFSSDSMLKPHFCPPTSNRQPVILREIRALPTSFEELLQYEQAVDQRRTGENGKAGTWTLPFSRKDAELLGKWLDDMLRKLVESKELEIGDMFRYAKGIYSICLDEVLVQVSAYCKELGQLLERVWSAYLSIIEKTITVSRLNITKTETKCAKEIERITAKLQGNAELSAKKWSQVKTENEELKRKIEELEEELSGKEETETGLRSKYMQLQTVYEDVKIGNLALKEELRIQKIKLEAAIKQLTEGSDDFTPLPRVRVKTFKDLRDCTPHLALRNDAFMSPLPTAPTPKSFPVPEISFAEMLLQNCTFHSVRNEQKLFSADDFHDQITETEEIYKENVEIQTENVEEIDKSSQLFIDTAKGKIDEYHKMIHVMSERIFSDYRTLNIDLETTLRTKISPETHPEDRKNALNTLIDRISTTNTVLFTQQLENIRDEIEFNGSNLVQILFLSLKSAFSGSKTDESKSSEPSNPEILFTRPGLDPGSDSKRAFKTRNARIALEYDRNALNIVTRVANSTGRQLKNITMKRVLLKQISQIYEDKLAYGREHENIRLMSLHGFVYAELLKKFGLQKVTELKYEQLAASALKHRQHPKVYAFARFLGLLDPLNSADFGYYLTSWELLKPYATGQIEDLVYIPRDSVLTIVQSTFETRISPTDFIAFMKEIQALEAIADIPALTGFVSLEEVLRIFMDIHKAEKESKRSFIQYIFDAVDLNRDGLLELSEIQLLKKYFSARPISDEFARKTFEEYADLSTVGAEDHFDAISFSNFAEILFTLQLFSQETFFKFAKVEKFDQIVGKLEEYEKDLKGNIEKMEGRLRRIQGEQGELLRKYFGAIRERLEGFKGDKIALWVAIRLVEEESKEQLVEQVTNSLLPEWNRLISDARVFSY